MLQAVTDYLWCINPVYRKQNGRWAIGSESRQRTYKAVEEVLRGGGASADCVWAVAASSKAAQKHGAEIKSVWRHVRRARALLHKQPEQLSLPL
jgi:hypothetical protein